MAEQHDNWTIALQKRGGIDMERQEAAILQLNIGLYCNQACSHCHVESSPKRTEMMDRATAEQCIRLLQSGDAATLDITGGAPELNSQFRCACLRVLDVYFPTLQSATQVQVPARCVQIHTAAHLCILVIL